MKSITFSVVKDDKGYVKTTLVPATHAPVQGADKVGLAIAGGLLAITAAFITMVLLVR